MPKFFEAKNSLIYNLGNNNKPIFKNYLNWSISSNNSNFEAWALIGNQSLRLIKALFRQSDKVLPNHSLSHPILKENNNIEARYPHELYSLVNFNSRLTSNGNQGFIDYTERYGSLMGDQTLTVFDCMKNYSDFKNDTNNKFNDINDVAKKLNLIHL